MEKWETEPLHEDKLHALEEDIHNCLERGHRFLRFPKKLENYFTEYETPKRRKRYTLLGLVAIAIFDYFCIADQIMLPDIYLIAWRIRLGVITPIIALILILTNLKWLQGFIDFLAGFLLLLTSATIILFLIMSHHINVNHYYSGIVLIIAYGNIVLRLRFYHALVFSTAIFILYASTVQYVTMMSVEGMQNSSLVLLTSVIISLIGNYQLESENRREFLLTLQQKINTSKLEEANLKLERLSISDELTGLANRRHFDMSFEREWHAAIRNKYPISLIFIDIDHFKLYNDNYGHHAGDVCLKKIGEALKKNIQRSQDLLVRYGGEEFIVLLPHTDIHKAIQLSEKIRNHIEGMRLEHSYSKTAANITVSLGVSSMIPTPEADSTQLLKQADTFLYQAKKLGRNQVCYSL